MVVRWPTSGTFITVAKTKANSISSHSGWTSDQTKPESEPA